MNQKKASRSYLSLYLLAFIGVTIVFFLVSFVMVHTVSDFVRDEMTGNAVNTAKTYSYTLEKNIVAYEAVTELLEDKIKAAGHAIVNAEDPDKLDLKQVANDLRVDSIDLYDEKGVVIASAYSGNVGWSVYEGHPVNTFFRSELETYLGPMRINTISNQEFQYGYFRMKDGGFVQIGVSAEHIRSFVDDFDMINNFNGIRNGNSQLYLTFIDRDQTILASTEAERIGQMYTEESVLEQIERGEEAGIYTEIGDEEVYQVFVPVYSDGVKQGTLAMAQSTRYTEDLLRRLSGVSLIILIFVYGALLILFFASYKRFKNLMNLAYFDQRTELPNEEYLKTVFMDEQFLSEDKRKALILVQYIRYKSHRSGIAHESSAEIMGRIGKSVKELTHYPVQIFSLADDQFILLVEEYKNKLELISLVEEVSNLAKEKFSIHGTPDYMSIRFGITEISDKKKPLKELLKEVKISLSIIGEHDEVNYAFFSYHTGRRLQMEDVIASELKEIIRDESTGGVHLLYQPIISMKDGSVSSFEALARFTSKKYGEVPPEKFIEIAEKNNLMIPLGNLIFTQAARYAKKLYEKGYDKVRVSVNISAVQLLHENFTEDLLRISEREGISGDHIILEVEESAFLENFREMNKRIKEIRKHGFKIAIDSFGTSHSSLRNLKEMKVDILKIDKTFIELLTPGDTSGYITSDIISLAHRLGLKVVAEGVELESQMEYLFHADCDCIQGYILGRPAKPEEASLTLIESPNSSWVKIMRRKFPFVTRQESLPDEPDPETAY